MTNVMLGRFTTKEARNANILRLWRSGMSYTRIADIHGLTRQRIGQIVGGEIGPRRLSRRKYRPPAAIRVPMTVEGLRTLPMYYRAVVGQLLFEVQP